MIVLDTNVVSAIMRPAQNPAVAHWLDRQSPESVWITAITVLEIRYGLLVLPEGRRRSELLASFDRVADVLFSGRILAFDQDAAARSAEIAARRRLSGKNVAPGDTQIAGIVAARGAVLATRNLKDFDDLDIALVDPWTA